MSQSADFSADDDEPLIRHKPMHDEAKFDITAMIDLVFMMNIYFLVTMVTAAMAEIDLPASRHCIPSDRDTSVVISILENREGGPGIVYVGEARSGEPVPDPIDQEQSVIAAVKDGVRENKTSVLIKAERHVRLQDVSRIGRWASSVQGVDLKLAVIEKE